MFHRTLLLSSLILATTTGLAEARGGGGSVKETMYFVAETGIELEDGAPALSLCHLVEQYGVLFVPLFTRSEGYVLAENRCDTTAYRELPAEFLVLARAEGLIPADVPDEPVLPTGERIENYAVGGGLGALILFGILGAIRRKRNQKKRSGLIGNVPPQVKTLLEVMCHAAKSDGRIDDSEVATIADIARTVTGRTIPHETVAEIAALASPRLSRSDFEAFGKGLRGDQKELLIQAAMAVVGADAQLSSKERDFIGGLAQGLGITPERFGALVGAAQPA